MKAYIQCGMDGIPYNTNSYAAYRGFTDMGFETVLFRMPGEIPEGNKEDVVVGGISTVRKVLDGFTIEAEEICYPPSLSKYLKRHIRESMVEEVRLHPLSWPIFIKPVQTKLFTGKVIREYSDLSGLLALENDQRVYCSEALNILSEYRAFIRYGEILDIRHYKGDWKLYPDPGFIISCIQDYTAAPAGYAADFGVTDTGETVLIEVNDGYSLGAYGLSDTLYAQLLSARWAELTGTEDECDLRGLV